MKILSRTSKNSTESTPLRYIKWMDDIGMEDVPLVGQANARIGNFIPIAKKHGLKTPPGFSITTDAYSRLCQEGSMAQFIKIRFDQIKDGSLSKKNAAHQITTALLSTSLPPDLEMEIRENYEKLSNECGCTNIPVIVRSSGIPDHHYSTFNPERHPTLFKVQGIKALIIAYKQCLASLFKVEALHCRTRNGLSLYPERISIGVQKMVNSDTGVAGNLYTTDPDTHFSDHIVINAAYGLGDLVVQGLVCPDEYRVFKPLLQDSSLSPIIEKTIGEKNIRAICTKDPNHPVCPFPTEAEEQSIYALTNTQIRKVAKLGILLEKEYSNPLDIEWAFDSQTQELFIIHVQEILDNEPADPNTIISYEITEKNPHIIKTGVGIGTAIVNGKAYVSPTLEDIAEFQAGHILVTKEITISWLPYLLKCSGVITDKGGRTSLAAKLCRQLKLPAILGANSATTNISTDQKITLHCAKSEIGTIFRGHLNFKKSTINLNDLPHTRTAQQISISSPNDAKFWWKLPSKGIGMARIESIIRDDIGIHPMAIINYDKIEEEDLKWKIHRLTNSSASPQSFFINRLARGIAQMAASCYPRPINVSFSNFESEEYAQLVSFGLFEPNERNPKIGFRGPYRYMHDSYAPAFAMECAAIKKAREEMGFTNINIAIPYCRTLKEAENIIAILEKNGLTRGDQGLEIMLIAEVPSNIISAEDFTLLFDRIGIDLDTLTQLVLGMDQDSDTEHALVDHFSISVLKAVSTIVEAAHKNGTKVTVFGLMEDHRSELMEYLIGTGVDSFAFDPENFVRGVLITSKAEKHFIEPITMNPNKP